MRTALMLLFALPLSAAVDGVVMNATTGKPAANVDVALVQPSQQGMKPLANGKTDGQGRFSFPDLPKGPGLIQATFQGVTYNKVLMPGAPASGLQVDVYESTKKPVAKIAQHMILLQPGGADVTVNETYLVQDEGKLTFNDPQGGTVHFFLPPEKKGDVEVTVNAPGGMPIRRAAEPTKQANVYKIDYPIKPGETRVDLSYTVPQTNPAVFAGRVLTDAGKTRLVVPNGVSLSGDGINEIGKEPQTQATIYDVTGDAFKVQIAGTGALAADTGGGAAAGGDDDNGSPQITEQPPHIYNHKYWILGLTLGVLALGMFLLARNGAAAEKS